MFTNDYLILGGLLAASVLFNSCAVGEIGGVEGGVRPGEQDSARRLDDPLVPDGGLEVEVAVASNPTAVNTTLPQVDPTCPSAAAVVSASNRWQSVQASEPAFETLDFEVMARPGATNLGGLLAIGAQDISSFSDAAILVQFASDGLVDARDGSLYDKDVTFNYEAGVWYEIAIAANLVTKTYDVEIGRCGEPRQTVITGAAFRSDASVDDALTTWAAFTPKSATLEVTTPSWVASGTCAPATCQSLGHECGQPSNGCGDTLDCGDCGSGEMCSSGVCIDEPVSVPPPPAPPPAPPPPPPGGGALPERPGVHNTGPSDPGTLTAYSGPNPITTPGSTYENFHYTGGGSLKVQANNVTLRNFKISGGSSGARIEVLSRSSVLFEDGEISGWGTGVRGCGFTARRLYMHDIRNDAFKLEGAGSNCGDMLIEQNYIEKIGLDPASHADGFQTNAGSSSSGDPLDGVLIQYNTLWIPHKDLPQAPPGTQANSVVHNSGYLENYIMDNNWLSGGGYTIYCIDPRVEMSITNNKFGGDYKWYVNYHSGQCKEWSGNVWDDTGLPVAP